VRHDCGLIRIAEQPKAERAVVTAAYAGIVAGVAQRMRAMLLGAIESKALLGMFATQEELAAKQKDRPGRMMSLEQKLVILLSLGQLEEFVRKVAGGLEPHPHVVEVPKPQTAA
jgi:hypothetical protein